MKTDFETFSSFCKKHKVRPEKKSERIYILPSSVIGINFFGLDIQPPEITVYFNEDGDWVGGTNWLWDDRLPWIRNKRKRWKAERKEK